MNLFPNWPPRDWRMMLALAFLAIAGAGAWILAKWSLDALVALSDKLRAIWPLAYFSYGTLAVLALPTLGFALVVGLKSFKTTGPGGTSMEMTGDSDQPGPTVTTTTATTVTGTEPKA